MELKYKKKGLFVSLDHIIDMTEPVEIISNGIVKKIRNQIACLEDYGYTMELYCPYANRNHRIHAVLRRFPFYWLRSFGKELVNKAQDYSFVYVRRPWFMDGDLVHFMQRMKQANSHLKVVFELPTYPGGDELNHLHMIPLLIKDRFWKKRLNKCVDRLLTFSKDQVIYGVRTINTCNAINPKQVRPVRNNNPYNDKSIHLIACSSMAYWHGYDRVMEGIRLYKEKHVSCPVVLDLVGGGEELENYKRFIKVHSLEENIKVHGFLHGKELDDVYNIADIALDSMGRHRSGVFYNSSLKGKEYCAKGLPIISGVETELDNDHDYNYYLRVPADNSPINIDDVINFYHSIYYQHKRKNVIDFISKYAEEHFSFKNSFKPLIEYING